MLKNNINATVQSPDDSWVYSMDSDNKISQFAVNPTDSGRLTIPGGGATPPAYATGKYPSMMAIDPGGWFIYASTSVGIYAYQVDYKTGKLYPVPGSPFGSGSGTLGIIPMGIDSGGNFLYVVDYSANTMTDYRIDRSSGALTAVATVTVPAQTVSVTSDSTGQYVYAYGATPPPASSEFIGYRLNQTTGALTPVPGNPYVLPQGGSGPIATTDGYLYAEAAQEVYGFAVNYSTGALTPVPGQPAFVNPGGDPQGLAPDRYGRDLWWGAVFTLSVPVSGGMQAIQIGAKGSITSDGSEQDAGDHYYTSLTESYTGKYVYGGGGECTNSGCIGSVKSWSIGSLGHLSPLSGPLPTTGGGTVYGIALARQDQQ